MKTETTNNILSEEYEFPVCLIDLQDTIDNSIEELQQMPSGAIYRQYKRKINELINEYNERRNMKIYCHI